MATLRPLWSLKDRKPLFRLPQGQRQTGVWLDGSYQGLPDSGSALPPEVIEFTIGAKVQISGMSDPMALTVAHAFKPESHPRCYYYPSPEGGPELFGTLYARLDPSLKADVALIRIDPRTKLDSCVSSEDGLLHVKPKLLQNLEGLVGQEVTTLSPSGLQCFTGVHNVNCCCGRVYCTDYRHEDLAFPMVAVKSLKGDNHPFHGGGDSGSVLIKRQLYEGNSVKAIGILFATLEIRFEEGKQILSLASPLKDAFLKFKEAGHEVTFPPAPPVMFVPYLQRFPDTRIPTLNEDYATSTTLANITRPSICRPWQDNDKHKLNLYVQPSGSNTSAGVSSYQATSEPSLHSPDRQHGIVPHVQNTRLTSSDKSVYHIADSGLDSSFTMRATSTTRQHRPHTYDFNE